VPVSNSSERWLWIQYNRKSRLAAASADLRISPIACENAISETLAVFLTHIKLYPPPHLGNQEKQHKQPIRNKEKVKNRF
jgi:hypothetical protein